MKIIMTVAALLIMISITYLGFETDNKYLCIGGGVLSGYFLGLLSPYTKKRKRDMRIQNSLVKS